MILRNALCMGAAVLAAVGVVGCGDDDGAGPSIPFTAAVVAQTDDGFHIEWTADDAGDVEVFAGERPEVGRDRKVGAGGSSGELDVTDLPDAARWYFELVPEDGDPLVIADRRLHLASVPNLRDLGGYRTTDGRWVRSGVLYRSGALDEITDEDFDTLTALGVKVVCDFRSAAEIADAPDPEIPGAENLHLDVADSGNLAKLIIEAIASGDPKVQEDLLGGGKAAEYLVDGGRAFVSQDSAKAAYARLFDRLADGASLPTLTHCTGGKDRAGWGSAAILTALGVPRAVVEEDYLLTNELLQHENEVTLERTGGLLKREWIEPLILAKPEYLGASFAEVDKVFGDFDAYLEDGLEVDGEQFEQLRENLLVG